MRGSLGFSKICRVRAAEEKCVNDEDFKVFKIKRKGSKYMMVSKHGSACLVDPWGHPLTSRPYRTYRKVLRALFGTFNPVYPW